MRQLTRTDVDAELPTYFPVQTVLVDDSDLFWLLAQSDKVDGGRGRNRVVHFRHDHKLLAREVQLLDRISEHNFRLPV